MKSLTTECEYSEYYDTAEHRYRHVHLNASAYSLRATLIRVRACPLLSEEEWRSIGITMSPGWENYEVHRAEPHVMLFRRKLPAVDSQETVRALVDHHEVAEGEDLPVSENATSKRTALEGNPGEPGQKAGASPRQIDHHTPGDRVPCELHYFLPGRESGNASPCSGSGEPGVGSCRVAEAR